jgi:hypothetical protein
MLHRVLLPGLLCLSACVPSGSGPTPRAVLVISSDEYTIERILEALDAVPGALGARVDKSKETISVGDRTLQRFPMYQEAYWYPFRRSEYYGIGIVKWVPGGEETDDRYFIDVYADDDGCSLCGAVKDTFDQRGVKYFSACEHPDRSTKFERIRCGT